MAASIDRFWPSKVFDPRRSPRHARRVQPRGAGEGETEAKVAPAVLQFKEKSTGVREPLPNAWRNQVGFSESDAGRESTEDI